MREIRPRQAAEVDESAHLLTFGQAADCSARGMPTACPFSVSAPQREPIRALAKERLAGETATGLLGSAVLSLPVVCSR
jgi:hypothetical protein